MTAQEMFDRIVVHAFTMKAPCRAPESGGCMYRGPDNCRCFIGSLIPDDKYDKAMEGISPAHSYNLDITDQAKHGFALLAATGITPDLIPLARNLQRIHDYHPIEEWPRRLRDTAIDYELSTLVVTQELTKRAKANAN